jgi:5-methylcytosine-specific restriction endonuclease McrA
VAQRDEGVCALCGLDARGLARALELAFKHAVRRWTKRRRRQAPGMMSAYQLAREAVSSYAATRGFSFRAPFWHVDHTVPVSEGGGSCGLENLRTRCVPCHRNETRLLRQRLASARRKAKRREAHVRATEIKRGEEMTLTEGGGGC